VKYVQQITLSVTYLGGVNFWPALSGAFGKSYPPGTGLILSAEINRMGVNIHGVPKK